MGGWRVKGLYEGVVGLTGLEHRPPGGIGSCCWG